MASMNLCDVTWSSRSRLACSTAFSSALSHVALAMRSSRIASTSKAKRAGGKPSNKNQPRQARNPAETAKARHDEARQRSADHARNRDRRHEKRIDARSPLGGKPVREAQDDARQKTRFRRANN